MLTGRLLALAGLYHVVALAALVGLAAWAWPAGVGGLLLGGLVMASNFAAARWLAARALQRPRHRGLYLALLGAKMALLLGLIAAIMHWADPNLLGFAGGLASFFVGLPLALAHVGLGGRAAVLTKPAT